MEVIKYAAFLFIGVGLFIWVYRGQDPGQIWDGLSKFDYRWILLSFLLAFISHFIRSLRWQMLITPLGYHPKRINTFFAILVMYMANFALPRLGEVTRCGILKRYDKVPFTSQLGTVVIERTVDFILLLGIVLFVFAVEWGRVSGLLTSQQLDSDSLVIRLLSTKMIFLAMGTLLVMVLIIWIFWSKIQQIPLVKKLMDWLIKFSDGLRSIGKLQRPFLFLLYSLLIYALYFGMTYCVLLGFEVTHAIGPMAALSVLALGSIGMVIPVQGGIGTYHFFAVETLLLYGIEKSDGQLLALVLHGSMSLFLILIGIIALILLPLVNKKF